MPDNLAGRPITFVNFPPATLIAGTTTTLTTTGAMVYTIDGKPYDKAAMTNLATPTTDSGSTSLPAFRPITTNQGSIYVFCLDISGNLKVAQGSVEALNAGAFTNAPQWPTVPETLCPFGYVIVKAGATAVAPWVFGTNNWAGVTGVTTVFGRLTQMTDRPIIA